MSRKATIAVVAGLSMWCVPGNASTAASTAVLAQASNSDGVAVTLSAAGGPRSPHAVIYVDDDAARDPGPGDPTIGDPAEDGSWEHPFDALQEAIDAAASGDEVIVRDGLYAGAGNKGVRVEGKSPYVHSEHGAEHCIVDLDGEGIGFLFGRETAAARLEGFTIRNGECGISCGGYTGDSPTIAYCIITGNVRDNDGAGVAIYMASPTLLGCRIVGNAAPNDRGGGVCIQDPRGGQTQIIDCVIAGNSADSGGGVCALGEVDVLIQGCLIYDNSAGWRGGGLCCPIDDGSIITIHNCSIVNNHAGLSELYGAGGGVYLTSSAAFPARAISGCILWGNTARGGSQQISFGVHSSGPAQRVAYCDIQDDQPFTTEFYQVISSDPLFADPANGDFHLSAGSPCINAGDPDFIPGEEVDIDGQPRVYGARIDIGADESYPFVDCNANGVADGDDIAAGASADCNDNQIPDECEFGDCNANGVLDECDLGSGASRDCNANGIPDECERDCNGNGIPDACDIAAGTSPDEDGDGIPDECAYTGRTLYVDDDAPGDPGPGDPALSDPAEDGSREHPFDSIQKAINAANSGDEVIIADGIYSGPGNTGIDYGGRGINVHSAHGPRDCVVDPQGTELGFRFHLYETTAARLAGVTIRNGWAEYEAGGIDCDDSSPLIEDCIITENVSVYYAAVSLNYSDATVQNCRIFDNDGSRSGGGGISCADGDPTISNCLIYGNAAVWGSGISCYRSEAVITGCTVVGNRSERESAIVCYEGRPVLRNCLVWGNDSRYGLEFQQSAGAHADIDYCDIRDELPGSVVDGGHNLRVDPLFLSYRAGRLADNSPCIDAGDAGFVPLPGESDIDGRTRVAGARVDIGAWEYDQSDCNGNGIPDVQDIALGGSADCDADGVPDDCQLGGTSDCNGNGQADLCDISAGISRDCNANSVPDECEPGGGQDCNADGVSDLCAILNGAADINGNGVPDECEPRVMLYVDDDAVGDPGPDDPLVSDPVEDGSARHPFDAIQKALNAAPDGTAHVVTILLANGAYTGPGNRDLDFCGKRLTLRSENGPQSCTIDCQQAGRGFYFHTGETAASRLEGITISNGIADNGGGVCCYRASPHIAGCIIKECVARESYGVGGGLDAYNDSRDPFVLTDCQILANVAFRGGGGGIRLAGGRHIVRNCRIVGNECVDGFHGGGGLTIHSLSTTIQDTLIAGNSCTSEWGIGRSGGGVWSMGEMLTIDNSTISHNLATEASAILTRESDTVVRNSIVWGSEPTGSDVDCSDLTVAFCDLAGGVPAGAIDQGGNIAVDPRFVDAVGGDFRLASGSPCIDAGDPEFVAERGETDVDGQLRVWAGIPGSPLRIDIGADEFNSFAAADLNCDARVDVFDIDPFLLALTDSAGYATAYPDCDLRAADLNYDGAVNVFDIDPFVQTLVGQ